MLYLMSIALIVIAICLAGAVAYERIEQRIFEATTFRRLVAQTKADAAEAQEDPDFLWEMIGR